MAKYTMESDRFKTPVAVEGSQFAELVAENKRLNDELGACTESPGGCGYWRDAARLREQERDQARVEIDELRTALQKIADLSNYVGSPDDPGSSGAESAYDHAASIAEEALQTKDGQ